MTSQIYLITLSQAPIILGRPFSTTAKAVIDWRKVKVILKVRDLTVKVDINKLMQYLSGVFEDLGDIDLCDDEDTEACIEEVMSINEEADFESYHWTSLHLSSTLYHLHSSMLFLIHNKKN